jgi:hypothetical protein
MAPGNSPGDVRRRSRSTLVERAEPDLINKIKHLSYMFDNNTQIILDLRVASALAPLRADSRCRRDAHASAPEDRAVVAGIVWAANQPD